MQNQENIAKYLKQNGIKQSFICDKTGLKQNSICSALNGKRKLSIEDYEKICNALNLPYQFFFEKDKNIEKYGERADKTA